MEDKMQRWRDTYVNYATFIWAISILMTIGMLAISISISAKSDVGFVSGKVDSQNTDIQWIKATLTEIKMDLKSIN